MNLNFETSNRLFAAQPTARRAAERRDLLVEATHLGLEGLRAEVQRQRLPLRLGGPALRDVLAQASARRRSAPSNAGPMEISEKELNWVARREAVRCVAM